MTGTHPVPAPEGAPAEQPAPLRTPRRTPLQRLTHRSLTSRLVVGVVTLVVVLVTITGGGTYYALRYFLEQRLDDQVQSTVGGGGLSELFGVVPISDSGVAPTPVWAVALNTEGQRLTFPNTAAQWIHKLRLSATDADRFTTAALKAGRSAATPVVSITTVDGTSLRATARQVTATNQRNNQQVPAIAVVGLSTGEERRILTRLLALEFIIGGAAIALALFMTLAGVRFSLRGLRRVTTTAQDVAAELSPSGAALQRRVPVTEKGTEVAQLTESFNTLLMSAETQFAARIESEERMRQFLADASHELRTPLTSIRGYAELARMQRAVGQADGDNLDRIESEGTRMSRLVEDLLLLARGDGAGNQPERVPIVVAALVEDAVDGVRAAFPERPIELDRLEPGEVIGDPDQLLRVVRNLIINAVVHTAPGPPVRVRALQDGPGLTIQVTDAGPGLPPEDAAHVFERFWRADKARTRARGGSGLGLSIVATIVQAHGGSVRFDSTVEHGSTVTVWLPAALP